MAPDVKYLRGTLDSELNFNRHNHEDKESNVNFCKYKDNRNTLPNKHAQH